MARLSREYHLKWRMGVLAGLAVCQLANKFKSKIRLKHNGRSANAKNVMSLSGLDPSHERFPDGTWNFGPFLGAHVAVTVFGTDAEEAMDALDDLFTCGDRVAHCRNTDCLSTPMLIDFDPQSITYACSMKHEWTVSRATGRVLAPALGLPD